ncbi:UNVERIFIED_CONTAM: hypothetical protein Slati_4538000 [Sesamum latifolium]|uniref:Uncharacterized protein n=1 Tax=Sesamum latifolium TaxID=2727402 RepID=A0AAW2SGH1_9LAMI
MPHVIILAHMISGKSTVSNGGSIESSPGRDPTLIKGTRIFSRVQVRVAIRPRSRRHGSSAGGRSRSCVRPGTRGHGSYDGSRVFSE